jgi:hypothetical protein
VQPPDDGTYRDRRWVNNYGWCLRTADSGRLTFFIGYFVWLPNWQQTVDTCKDMIRTAHPKMAVMLDVESWSGQIRGDRSAGINAAYEAAGAVVESTTKVTGYGSGLPEGAPPFGRCDMNSADGLTSTEYARA